MIFRTLVSGSSGNAVLFSDNKTNILIDCGISAKRLIPLLCQAGISAQDIHYIFVTHEHTDHSYGVGVLSRKFDIPVIASEGTWNGMNAGRLNPQNIVMFSDFSPIPAGTVTVTPFKIPHDANMPTGYVIECNKVRYAVATDMGYITKGVANTLKGCRSVILEANYDKEMLQNGSYPYILKKRILSNSGHLCNTDTAKLAAFLFENGTENIILGHLSNENNTPETAYETVLKGINDNGISLGDNTKLFVAPRYEISVNAG